MLSTLSQVLVHVPLYLAGHRRDDGEFVGQPEYGRIYQGRGELVQVGSFHLSPLLWETLNHIHDPPFPLLSPSSPPCAIILLLLSISMRLSGCACPFSRAHRLALTLTASDLPLEAALQPSQEPQ